MTTSPSSSPAPDGSTRGLDEGGWGLFLVARFARRWGTRYTDRGKAIWSEQALDAAEAGFDETMGDLPLDQWDEPTP